MRKIVNIVMWVSLVVVILVVGFLAKNHYNNTPVKALKVEINYSENGESNRFLTYEDINTFVRHRYDSLKGRKIKDIDLEQIENDLLDIPYVKNANLYETIDGQVQMRIKQRKAIVRIIDALGDQFYLDDEAHILPIRSFFPAHVLICNGFIGNIGFYSKHYSGSKMDSIVNNSILKEIYNMAKYINNDNMLRHQIVQMNVDINGEFTLVPLVSNHIIKFGKADNIDAKFTKLKLFYTEGLGHHRWNNYRVINLKYKNQIVCTKN